MVYCMFYFTCEVVIAPLVFLYYISVVRSSYKYTVFDYKK